MPNERANDQREFQLKEYEALRAEIMARLDELWKLETFALGGAAAIAAWLFTHTAEAPPGSAGWWLPFVFLAICGARFAAGMYHLAYRKSEYVCTIERDFLGDRGGWETWFGKQGYNETIAYSIVWAVALGVSLWLPSMPIPSNSAPERAGKGVAVQAAPLAGEPAQRPTVGQSNP